MHDEHEAREPETETDGTPDPTDQGYRDDLEQRAYERASRAGGPSRSSEDDADARPAPGATAEPAEGQAEPDAGEPDSAG